MEDERRHGLQAFPLSKDAAKDLVGFAALLGWDAVVPTMTAMAVATHKLSTWPNHLAGVLAGFDAVKIWQGQAMCLPQPL